MNPVEMKKLRDTLEKEAPGTDAIWVAALKHGIVCYKGFGPVKHRTKLMRKLRDIFTN